MSCSSNREGRRVMPGVRLLLATGAPWWSYNKRRIGLVNILEGCSDYDEAVDVCPLACVYV